MPKYKSKYTGPQIDSGVSRALPGGEIDAALTGKVNKAGDTMTGSLTISKSNYPELNIKNTGSGSAAKIRNSAHGTQIMSQEDESNYRALALFDKSVTTDARNILQIQQIENGRQTASYNVYHTGNKPSLDDIGAAASDHKHNAGDITSGTFKSARLPTVPVSKGGTGKTTLTSGSYLVGDGTSAVTLKTAVQVASDIGAQFTSRLTEYALDQASSVTAGHLYYLKMENGVSVIRGVVGGSFTSGTVIGTLPSGYRPVSAYTGIAFATASSGTSLCTYEIATTGTITIKNLPSTYQYVTLSSGIFKSN